MFYDIGEAERLTADDGLDVVHCDGDDDDVVDALMMKKSLSDLSALSGILHSASSIAPSSPEPPSHSGCTAAHRG